MNSYLDWDLDAEDLGLPPGSTADEMEHAFATSPPEWVVKAREWCVLTGGSNLGDDVIAPEGMELLDTMDAQEWWWGSAPARRGIVCRGYPVGAGAETCVRIWCMRHGATIRVGVGDALELRLPTDVIGTDSEDWSRYLVEYSWGNLWARIKDTTFYKHAEMP